MEKSVSPIPKVAIVDGVNCIFEAISEVSDSNICDCVAFAYRINVQETLEPDTQHTADNQITT